VFQHSAPSSFGISKPAEGQSFFQRHQTSHAQGVFFFGSNTATETPVPPVFVQEATRRTSAGNNHLEIVQLFHEPAPLFDMTFGVFSINDYFNDIPYFVERVTGLKIRRV
jgi:hypothetical protein